MQVKTNASNLEFYIYRTTGSKLLYERVVLELSSVVYYAVAIVQRWKKAIFNDDKVYLLEDVSFTSDRARSRGVSSALSELEMRRSHIVLRKSRG